MTAMFTDKFLESLQESIMKPGGYFGAVSPSFDTAFQVNRNASTHLLSVLPAAIVGALCGAIAAGFHGDEPRRREAARRATSAKTSGGKSPSPSS